MTAGKRGDNHLYAFDEDYFIECCKEINGGKAPTDLQLEQIKRAKRDKAPKRGETQGWNPAVSRRMTQWLYSVGIPQLTGSGYSFTFTVKDCPPSAQNWAKLVKALAMRFKRRGVVRYHWLTEWQSRGVPHLHGCVYFDSMITNDAIIDLWVDVARQYNPLHKSQNVKPIYDDVGWFKYLSKHAVRGVQHYQRNGDNMPKEWKGHTGRMWGKGGDWGVQKPMRFDLDDKSYCRFRRIVRSWRKSKARCEHQTIMSELLRTYQLDAYRLQQSKRNIIRARSLLKSHDRKVSNVRGVNEFFGLDESIRIAVHLNSYDDAIVEQL